MSDMKCPFCQRELKCWDEPQDAIYANWSCPNCRRFAYGNKLIWQEVIHTRKALDVAKDAIDVISLKYHKDTPSIFLIKYAQNAKDQITALEQKDVK